MLEQGSLCFDIFINNVIRSAFLLILPMPDPLRWASLVWGADLNSGASKVFGTEHRFRREKLLRLGYRQLENQITALSFPALAVYNTVSAACVSIIGAAPPFRDKLILFAAGSAEMCGV